MAAYGPKKGQAAYCPKMAHPNGAKESSENEGSIASADGEIGSHDALYEKERFVIPSPFCYPHLIGPLAPPSDVLSVAKIAPQAEHGVILSIAAQLHPSSSPDSLS